MFNKSEILAAARRAGVRFVRLQFLDLFGILKNVEIPVTELEDALDGRIMFDGSSIQGFVRIEESDMYLRPDLRTWLVFPPAFTDATVARLICNVCLPDGRPFAGDPRAILQRVVSEAAASGLDACRVGVELEFFLLKQDARGKPTPEPNDFGGYFDIAPTDAGENCRRDIVLALERMGMDVAGSHHETSPGQHEIDFGLVDILTAADNVATAKLVARTISRKHGLHATFMPKPLQDEDGCSMHCHFVLPAERSSADRGKAREDGTFSLSRTVQSYIAGLLRHAPALTCITNPVVNSYKRLVPGFEAPSHIFWSTRHRMPFIRVAVEEGTGVKIELRSPDPSCNPYLAFAVALKAGLDGVQNDMDAPPPVYASVASMSEEERFREGIATLPRNLEQALEALEEDEIIRDALGEHAYHHFVQAKLLEWEQYEKTVHPWEWEQYLTL